MPTWYVCMLAASPALDRDVALFAAAIGVYLLLTLVVLPRLGFNT